MAKQIQPRMDLKSFEALQRATVTHAVQNGINRPSYIDLENVPVDVMEIQKVYARGVFARGPDKATFDPEFSPEQGTVARNTLVSALREYWKGKS